MKRLGTWIAIASLAAGGAAGALAAACGSSEGSSSAFPVDGGSPGADGASGDDGGAPPNLGGGDGGSFTDFPAPVIDGDGGVPSGPGALFGPPSQGAAGGGPCLFEPEVDALYPQNWLRPRFRWTAAGGQNVFELRLHVDNQTSDLVVYTNETSWTMPRATWDALRLHSAGSPMTVTIRGAAWDGTNFTGESIGTTGPLGVAPVQATGAIVYWTTTNGSALKGFTPGDESVVPVLAPAQVKTPTATCVGCHTSTPDGEFVGFSISAANNLWPNAIALIDQDAGAVGSPPSFLGAGATAALAMPNLGISSFSPAHWATGDRREVVAWDNSGSSTSVLEWIDLEAASAGSATGTIARDTDPAQAGAPTWSHDGTTIAYVSTNRPCTGRLGRCDSDYQKPDDVGATADLYTVPYAGGAGGHASAVKGASDPAFEEYYPAYSPDDRLLAFTRIAKDLNMYDQPAAEVFVLPSSGGTATRLAANDPPACVGKHSPGITNSWPKWGPAANSAGGSTYYWLVFSSTRAPAGNPQLYMTSIVADATGALTTHGAIYLWNQPDTENNHTPAWDAFKVAPQPPPK